MSYIDTINLLEVFMYCKGLSTSLVTVLLISGCADSVVKNSSDGSDFANKAIADRAAEAAKVQAEYVAIVNNDKAVLGRKQSSLNSDLIDIDYIGAPQELLQTFAYRYGYRYVEIGKYARLKPINIRVQKTSPENVLRNIGYQIDHSADVTLDQKSKTIRLTYK